MRVARDEQVADGVPAEVLATWRACSAHWFGAERRPVPGAEDRAHLALVETEVGPVVAKRAPPRAGWRGRLASTRAARAARAFALGRALRASGIATPEPLAAWREGASSVLVTRYVEGVGPWAFLARAIPSPHPPRGETGAGRDGFRVALENLAETFGAALAGLHAAGFRHRDLKAPNLLLVEREAGPPALHLLDLDGVARHPAPPRTVRARDLARLCASLRSRDARAAGVRRGDWTPFVRAYLAAAEGGAPDPAALGALVAATRRWAERHVEANLRRGRPVT